MDDGRATTELHNNAPATACSQVTTPSKRTPLRCYHLQHLRRFLHLSNCLKCLHVSPSLRVHFTFYCLHLTYFLVLAALGSIALLLSSKSYSQQAMTFVDALYIAVSALSVTGLMCLRMEALSYPNKIVIFLLMILGSHIFTSFLPLYVRRLKFRRFLYGHGERHLDAADLTFHPPNSHEDLERPTNNDLRECFKSLPKEFHYFQSSHYDLRSTNVRDKDSSESELQMQKPFTTSPAANGAGGCCAEVTKSMDKEQTGSLFIDTSLQWRELEYQALTSLTCIVVVYFFGVQFVGFIVLEVYLLHSPHALQLLEERGLHHSFFSFFSSVSAFANSGFSLLDDSLIPLRKSVFLLLCISMLILVGNTMFPPCIRMVIWLLHRFSKGKTRNVYAYLLRYPRKCYTHLFPRSHTRWLVATVAGFSASQLLLICILSWNSSPMSGLSTTQKLVDFAFQSITTRSAGENVVNLPDLPPSILLVYLGMMYISVYPVFLSRQSSIAPREIHEEADFPIVKDHWEADSQDSLIVVQSRKLLFRDSAYLFMAVFIICLTESKNIAEDPLNYSIFSIIFEVISAYGNVGLSMGYSCDLRKLRTTICEDVPYSFSGKWSNSGKMIMVIVMLYGRHRGLPENIDSALRWPNDEQEWGRV